MTTDERLEKVEGQLARVKWFNRCLIGCIVLSLGTWFIVKTFGPETAWAQSAVKEIRANKFVVEDENGKTRATLATAQNGPMLSLSDENGVSRIRLEVTDVPSVLLCDEKGKSRMMLRVGKDEPLMLLIDENGKVRAELSTLRNPQLSLKDENGTWRAVLTVTKAGPFLWLRDRNGKEIWSAP